MPTGQRSNYIQRHYSRRHGETEMRKRTRKRIPKTQNSRHQQEGEEEQRTGKGGKGFYACYLLTSLCPRFKAHTYIGFTVNPWRRIRQHNGEIRCGAVRTKKRQPWEMVLCLYGFPTHVSALQFEWAWQHPAESVAVRQAAAAFKSFSGIANRIKLAYTMLSLPAWQSLNITVNYFSTQYTKHSSGCPSLPKHMKVQVCPMDELPCYSGTGENLAEYGDKKHCWDDEDEYENASNEDVQAWSMDEFPCYSRREHGSFEHGDGKDDERSETSNTSGSIETTHPAIPELDDVQQSGLIDSLVTRTTSIVNSFSVRETTDGDIRTLNNENVSELDWPRDNTITGEVAAGKEQPIPSVPHEIEIIDLLSPSPECRSRPCSKKRKVSTVCTEIIDLT